MRCVSCGAEIPNGVKFCPACGFAQPEAPIAPPPPPPPQYSYQAPAAPPPPVYAQPKPSTTGQVVFSIINLFCCTILGIIALVFAIQAGSAATYEDAVKKLKTAKTLNVVGLILGILSILISLVAGLLPMILGIFSGDFSGFEWSTY